MKVEVSPVQKAFTPITLTITFESRDELLDMYVRNRVGNKKITDHIAADYSAVERGIKKGDYINAVNSISDDYPPILKALRPLMEALA